MAEDFSEDEQMPDVPEEAVGEISSEEAVLEESSSEPQAESADPVDAWQNFRSMPEFEGADDNAIAGRLYEAMQREQAATDQLGRLQAIMPATSEYLSNRELFEQWKESQQAAAQPKEEEAPWWNPPRVNEAYQQYLMRDEHGREMVAEGAPLEAQQQLQAYQAYRANFARNFLEDPQKTLGPMVERIVAERAQTIAQNQINDLKDKEFIARIESENRDWLYDEAGNAAPAGLLVQKYIEDAKSLGIQGVENRWNYAYKLVERDALLRKYQQQAEPASAPPPAQPEAKPQETQAEQNMQYLRRQAQRKPAARATAGNTNTRTPEKPMSFADRFLATIKEQGLTPTP